MEMTNNGSLIKVKYEGAQTVVPHKQTCPRLISPISIDKSMESSIFKRSFHMILCYNRASTEDSGPIMAGWTKTSMGFALSDQPLLAGRVRRVEDGNGELEIVANDSGIRLVEARIPINLEGFLGLTNKEEVQKQLVFWDNIDDQDPQFSPLLCIQVTSFKCGAYSMGISCSILLSDPLSMTSFLKHWVKVHNKILNETRTPKLPIFYGPNFANSTTTLYNSHNPSTLNEFIGQTLIFKFPQKNLTLDNEMHQTVALSCIETAIHRTKKKVATSKFCLLVKEAFNGIAKISTISVKQESLMESLKISNGENIISNDYIDAGDIKITEGNMPVEFVYWVSSPFPFDEGLVFITSSDLDMTVIVTIPAESTVI